jgi:hypothetical protein
MFDLQDNGLKLRKGYSKAFYRRAAINSTIKALNEFYFGNKRFTYRESEVRHNKISIEFAIPNYFKGAYNSSHNSGLNLGKILDSLGLDIYILVYESLLSNETVVQCTFRQKDWKKIKKDLAAPKE